MIRPGLGLLNESMQVQLYLFFSAISHNNAGLPELITPLSLLLPL
jgi:hypothetical protein